MLKKVDFAHCSVFHLILNLWTYWACIMSGKNYDRLSDYFEWNSFYIKQRWPSPYLPFEMVYEKIKKQDKLFRPGHFAPGDAKR